MCSWILFPLYSNDLSKYENCLIKTCFQRGFNLKISFIKRNFIYKEKSGFICKEKYGAVTKVKLVTKIKKLGKLRFILELWY